MINENITELKYSEDEIIRKRNSIRNKFIIKSPNVNTGKIQCISKVDLEILFRLYDEEFFRNYFSENLKENLTFSLSTRMTNAAGKTMYTRKSKPSKAVEEAYEIRIGIKFFFQYDVLDRDKVVSGINTVDSLEALQIVFEHELCHLIEFHIYCESRCKKLRFKIMVNNIFAHTEVHHQLPGPKEIISKKYGLTIGQKVSFACGNKKYIGFLYRINKRATVMVNDDNGTYRDGNGNKYSKWYVQFEQLV
ncbi:hypothetical protein [Clostridium sp.]